MEDRLSTLVGVKPSPEWLHDCQNYIRSNTGDEKVNINDEILHQILHCDLRDAVRRLENEGSSFGQDESASVIVRRAIHESSGDNQCYKSILPDTFRHMVQIEELLDVSRNAEDRLSVGPTSITSPTPVGNQKKRCLKMAISDGYFENGCFARNTEDTNASSSVSKSHVIVAMEIHPIKDLSVHSYAGIKMILQGPITVRFGVLMLNPGNATVLGGYIPELVKIQKKALEMAKKFAGIGVDPTIKALVWNPHTGMEEEEDEGERESSDVPMSAIPQLHSNGGTSTSITNVKPSIQANVQDIEALPATHHNSRSSQNVIEERRNNKITRQNFPSQQQNHEKSRQSHSTTTSSKQIKGSYTNISIKQQTSSMNNMLRSSPLRCTTNNPYNKKGSIATKRSEQSSKHESQRDVGTSYTIVTNTPVQRTSVRDVAAPVDLTSPESMESMHVSETSVVKKSRPREHGQKVLLISSSVGSVLRKNRITATTPIKTNPEPLLPAALSEPLSFQELYSLLLNILGDRDKYKQNTNKTFIVPSKMYKQPFKTGFNIVKSKNWKKKKLDSSDSKSAKYEYTMNCQMTGANDEDGVISCKLSSTIIEPFMTVAPGDMRKLHRENKEEANKLVNEGGKQILSELRVLAPCHFKLFYTLDEFGAMTNSLDGEAPVLQFCSRG